MNCIFCNIVNQEIPCNKVYEDENIFAFYDLDPKAPVHVLIIPKKHIESIDNMSVDNSFLISKIFEGIKCISKKLKLKNGYRVVSNFGEDGGQTVNHMHFHLLGGRSMNWPPG